MTTNKIFTLIPKVMSDVGAIGKHGNNTQQGYKFRSIDDVYNALHPVLAKHGVFFAPSILESSEERFLTKNGTSQVRVKIKVKYNVYADDGSTFETVVEGEGIDTGDKATNKALTSAFKYLLIQVFCIPIVDLEDADKHSPEMAPPKKTAQNRSKPSAQTLKEKLSSEPYIVTFGKFKGLSIDSVSVDDLTSYLHYIESSAKNDGKEITGKVLEFVNQANAVIEAQISRDTNG